MNLKAGDVVIRTKAGISIASFATVRDHGMMPGPGDWMTGTLTDARAWATKVLAMTKGTVHETHLDGRPFSN